MDNPRNVRSSTRLKCVFWERLPDRRLLSIQWIAAWLALVGIWSLCRPILAASKQTEPAPLVLDDPPERLVPKNSRSEAQQDHLKAMSLFSAGRLYEQRDEFAKALSLYERALRYDPKVVALARAIIPLASRLDRHAEAIRYAKKVAELDESDAAWLKRLGIFLTQTEHWKQALALYEKAEAVSHGAAGRSLDALLWMEMGRLYHLVEDYKKGAEKFARVLDALEHPQKSGVDDAVKKVLLGDPGPTYALIGDCFLQAGRFDEAKAAFEKSHALSPNAGLLGFHLAQIDAKTGKPERALERLQTYFDARQSDEGLVPYELLAELLDTLHRRQELLKKLERMAALDSGNVPLGYFLVEEYRKAGMLAKAQALYVVLLAKMPTTVGYRGLLDVCHKLKKPDDFLSALAEAVARTASLEPLAQEKHRLTEDAAWTALVLQAARKRLQAAPKPGDVKDAADAKKSKDVPESRKAEASKSEKAAKEEAKKPEGIKPGGREEAVAVGLLAMEAGDFDAAAEFYDRAIALQPAQGAEIILTWGLGLLAKEQSARAVAVFRRGIDSNVLPEDSPVLPFYLAGALEINGKTDEALAAARKALDLAVAREKAQAAAPKAAASKQEKNPSELPRYLARVGWVLFHSKRYPEAVKVYTDLVSRFGQDFSSDEIRDVVRQSRLVLSNMAAIRGDHAEAVEWLEQVLDEFPDDPSALNDLGYLWADQGTHLARARTMIVRALEAEPDNAAYHDSLGWVLFRLGKLQEACAELEKAVAKDQDATMLDHLGDVYRALGQLDQARDAWRRAVEAHRKDRDEEKAAAVETKLSEAK